MVSVESVQALFPKDLEDMLLFEQKADHIRITPRQYLGSENFAKIAVIVRDAGGEYVSAGKESHFRIATEQEKKGNNGTYAGIRCPYCGKTVDVSFKPRKES